MYKCFFDIPSNVIVVNVMKFDNKKITKSAKVFFGYDLKTMRNIVVKNQSKKKKNQHKGVNLIGLSDQIELDRHLIPKKLPISRRLIFERCHYSVRSQKIR